MGNNEYFKEWLKYANTDYSVALFIQNHHPVPIEIICYHCQQAGEKALKAVLALHNEEIPKTHDLYKLLELLSPHYPDMITDFAEQAVRLSHYATITRYPEDADELTDVDMTIALRFAKQILSHVESLCS